MKSRTKGGGKSRRDGFWDEENRLFEKGHESLMAAMKDGNGILKWLFDCAGKQEGGRYNEDQQ